MIEFPVGPVHCIVATLASGWKTQLYVIHWRCCSVVILQMARRASRSGQVVIIIDVTVKAGSRRIRMCIRQCKAHRIVVESGRLPRTGVVALLASL